MKVKINSDDAFFLIERALAHGDTVVALAVVKDCFNSAAMLEDSSRALAAACSAFEIAGGTLPGPVHKALDEWLLTRAERIVSD